MTTVSYASVAIAACPLVSHGLRRKPDGRRRRAVHVGPEVDLELDGAMVRSVFSTGSRRAQLLRSILRSA